MLFRSTARQDGDLEAELANARAHAVHNRVVLPGVSDIEDEPIDWPDLNL